MAITAFAGLGSTLDVEPAAELELQTEASNDNVPVTDVLAGEARQLLNEVGGTVDTSACDPPSRGCCVDCGGWLGGNCAIQCDSTALYPCCYCNSKNTPHCSCASSEVECNGREASDNLVETIKDLIQEI